MNAISIGDDLRFFFGFSNCQDISISKFCIPISHPSSMTIFLSAISAVFAARSREQMIWIYARRIVTPMQNIMTIWNRTIPQSIRTSMSGISFGVFSPNINYSIFKFSVSLASLPFPTWCIKFSRNLFDSGKKTFFCDRFGMRRHKNNNTSSYRHSQIGGCHAT